MNGTVQGVGKEPKHSFRRRTTRFPRSAQTGTALRFYTDHAHGELRGWVRRLSFSSLTRHLNLARGKVRDGLRLEVAGRLDPNRLPAPRRKTVSEEFNRSGEVINDQVRGLGECVLREDRDPRPERWMRLSLTEWEGSDVSESEFSPDFLKELRSAKGLLFFADDGYFRDLSPTQRPRQVSETQAVVDFYAALYANPAGLFRCEPRRITILQSG